MTREEFEDAVKNVLLPELIEALDNEIDDFEPSDVDAIERRKKLIQLAEDVIKFLEVK